ncbi:uncharacterized protein LOC142483925 [Ascaphus truei]|uniref:uncharacterized protein LOC142483925 n=1 Tax=Ascaphus truei TaxID=8439 RepID=UPI003F592BAF
MDRGEGRHSRGGFGERIVNRPIFIEQGHEFTMDPDVLQRERNWIEKRFKKKKVAFSATPHNTANKIYQSEHSEMPTKAKSKSKDPSVTTYFNKNSVAAASSPEAPALTMQPDSDSERSAPRADNQELVTRKDLREFCGEMKCFFRKELWDLHRTWTYWERGLVPWSLKWTTIQKRSSKLIKWLPDLKTRSGILQINRKMPRIAIGETTYALGGSLNPLMTRRILCRSGWSTCYRTKQHRTCTSTGVIELYVLNPRRETPHVTLSCASTSTGSKMRFAGVQEKRGPWSLKV